MRLLIFASMGLGLVGCAHQNVESQTARSASGAAYAPELTIDQEGGTGEFAESIARRVKSYSSNFLKCYERFIGEPNEEFSYREFQIEFSFDTDRGRIQVEPDSHVEPIDNAKYRSADICMRDILARVPFKIYGTAHFTLNLKF